MIVAVVAAVFFVVLCALARRANARLRGEDRLPMQWSITGEVTWSAPRPVALGFVPASAIPVFASLILLTPRPGQEGIVLPVTVAAGITFVAVQRLHVWLIGRTIARNGN